MRNIISFFIVAALAVILPIPVVVLKALYWGMFAFATVILRFGVFSVIRKRIPKYLGILVQVLTFFMLFYGIASNRYIFGLRDSLQDINLFSTVTQNAFINNPVIGYALLAVVLSVVILFVYKQINCEQSLINSIRGFRGINKAIFLVYLSSVVGCGFNEIKKLGLSFTDINVSYICSIMLMYLIVAMIAGIGLYLLGRVQES